MTWLLIGVLAWLALAVPIALMVAHSIRTADAHRAARSETKADEGNFVASDVPPAEAPQPWTGPSTLPFPPPPSLPRKRPPVVRHPVDRNERDPAARDSDPL